MMKDPEFMTRHEREAEVSAILSAGYLRLLVIRTQSRNPLAESAESKPSCHNGPEDKLKEVT